MDQFHYNCLNVLLPQLHHTHRPVAALREAAVELARTFGLPGVLLVRPRALTPADRARAACVRAFLGEPRLVLLESPVQAQFADLIPLLLNALAAARDKGAAAIWLTRSDLIWRDRPFPATCRLRLTEYGSIPMRQAT
jgi:phospholipid/cholesterol/gamma-HCH transport system ATP-binding protein